MTALNYIVRGGALIPADKPAIERQAKLSEGRLVYVNIVQPRNPGYHKRAFTLLNFAFEYWEPDLSTTGYGKPLKSFDRFRKDLTILAGRYHVVTRLDGSTRVEADSISFSDMDQKEFESLFSAWIDVIISKVAVGLTEADVRNLVDGALSYV